MKHEHKNNVMPAMLPVYDYSEGGHIGGNTYKELKISKFLL